jgi:hypothetical protein
MPEKARRCEMAALYLELASECFVRSSAASDDAVASEAMRRMGRTYAARAAALDPSLTPARLITEAPASTAGLV